jgi:hypothetical protein
MGCRRGPGNPVGQRSGSLPNMAYVLKVNAWSRLAVYSGESIDVGS